MILLLSTIKEKKLLWWFCKNSLFVFKDKDPFAEDANTDVTIGTVQVRSEQYTLKIELLQQGWNWISK